MWEGGEHRERETLVEREGREWERIRVKMEGRGGLCCERKDDGRKKNENRSVRKKERDIERSHVEQK